MIDYEDLELREKVSEFVMANYDEEMWDGNGSGHFHFDIHHAEDLLKELAELIVEKQTRELPVIGKDCRHVWIVPQSNEHIDYGDYKVCVKCHALRSPQQIEAGV